MQLNKKLKLINISTWLSQVPVSFYKHDNESKGDNIMRHDPDDPTLIFELLNDEQEVFFTVEEVELMVWKCGKCTD